MLNLTDHLRRLRVDKYEYIAMKVIVLLQSGKCWLPTATVIIKCAVVCAENIKFPQISDTSDLREPEKVCASQEKALQALQQYTLSHYPESPSKFGELLLRIPELQRTCQVRQSFVTSGLQPESFSNHLTDSSRRHFLFSDRHVSGKARWDT